MAAAPLSSVLFLLNALFAGAYSPHFKATRRPLERALEPFALTAQLSSLSLFLALSAHSVAAFYLPPEPCVSYEPRKATDSILAGSGASCVLGGAVGSTAHEADTTHASNILLSVVGHSREREGGEQGRLKQLCSVFTLGGQLELKLVLGGG